MTDESLLIVDGDRFVHDALERALEGLGATDCIRKPFDPIEVRARVEAALRLGRMIGLLRDQAWIDPLTGLENRAALDAALDAAAADFERVGQPAALLLLDLDRFKEVNDEYGHGVGDELLRGVGAAIHAGCRPYDTSARFGGDEFAVVFTQAEGEGAQTAAERVLAAIRRVAPRRNEPAETAS